MSKRLRTLSDFCADDSGSTAIEYALIAVLVSLACIAGLVTTRNNLQNILQNAASALGVS